MVIGNIMSFKESNSQNQTSSRSDLLPLCVDLDGTLIEEDVTQKSLWALLAKNPFYGLFFFFWLLRGRAFFKRQLVNHITLDPSQLVYNKDVLELIKKAQKKGQDIILATAADEKMAHKVAHYLGCFNTIIASDGKTNQRAYKKAQSLINAFGKGRFIYIGNSKDDLYVWASAQTGIAVNVSPGLAKKIKRLSAPVALLSYQKEKPQNPGLSFIKKGFAFFISLIFILFLSVLYKSDPSITPVNPYIIPDVLHNPF